MEELSKEDWAYYRAMVFWEPVEAACLLKGFSPLLMHENYSIFLEATRILNLIQKACLVRAIDYEVVDIDKYGASYDYKERLPFFVDIYKDDYDRDIETLIVFKPLPFLCWAERSGLQIPHQIALEGEWVNNGGYNKDNLQPLRFKELPQIWGGVAPISIEPSTPLVIDETPLTKTESQELGRLRFEKSNWDESLKAAVAVGQWIGTLEYKLTRPMLKDFMQKEFPEIEGKTMNNRLWKSIPDNAKNDGSGLPNQPMKDLIE